MIGRTIVEAKCVSTSTHEFIFETIHLTITMLRADSELRSHFLIWPQFYRSVCSVATSETTMVQKRTRLNMLTPAPGTGEMLWPVPMPIYSVRLYLG